MGLNYKTLIFQRLLCLIRQNALLIGIFCLAIFLRIFYLGHVEFDEINWITGAKNIIAGVFDPNVAFPTSQNRYAMMFFLAGYIKLLGYNHLVLVPITLIPALGSILIVYLLGLKIKDKQTGLIAAFLLAIFPLNIKYSSFLEVDIIISSFMGLCALLYFYKKNRYSFFWIGVLIGISFFIKFFNMLIFLVIAINLILEKNNKAFLPLIIGFFLAITPFTIYQIVETGNPIFHITSLSSEVEQYNEIHVEDMSFWKYLFNPFNKEPEHALFNIYLYLIFILIYIIYQRKEKTDNFFWIWLLLGYLPNFSLIFLTT